jgi:hypothetical protein
VNGALLEAFPWVDRPDDAGLDELASWAEERQVLVPTAAGSRIGSTTTRGGCNGARRPQPRESPEQGPQ